MAEKHPARESHMADNSNSSSAGVPILGLLGIVFVTLKLCHVINWSWWWVLAPFWGGVAAYLALVLIVAVVSVLVDA